MNVKISNKKQLHEALHRAVVYIKHDVGRNLDEVADVLRDFANELIVPDRPYTWSDYKHDAVEEEMRLKQDPGESAAPVKADDIEDVLNHCVWKSDGKMYFQLSSLERYLRKIQFKDFSTTQMGSMIRDKGGDSKLHRVNKNTTKNLFFIPDPRPQEENKLNIPKVKEDVPF